MNTTEPSRMYIGLSREMTVPLPKFWLSLLKDWLLGKTLLITDRVCSKTGGYVFTGVCQFRGEGYHGQVPVPDGGRGGTPILPNRGTLILSNREGGNPARTGGTPLGAVMLGRVTPLSVRLLRIPAGGLSCFKCT